jgi:hypothetical protein
MIVENCPLENGTGAVVCGPSRIRSNGMRPPPAHMHDVATTIVRQESEVSETISDGNADPTVIEPRMVPNARPRFSTNQEAETFIAHGYTKAYAIPLTNLIANAKEKEGLVIDPTASSKALHAAAVEAPMKNSILGLKRSASKQREDIMALHIKPVLTATVRSEIRSSSTPNTSLS